MGLNFLSKIIMLINLILLTLQLFLMDVFWEFYHYPILNLMVPVIALINVLFFVFWVIKFKWPYFFLFFQYLLGLESGKTL